jgi:hypothetical protein
MIDGATPGRTVHLPEEMNLSLISIVSYSPGKNTIRRANVGLRIHHLVKIK